MILGEQRLGDTHLPPKRDYKSIFQCRQGILLVLLCAVGILLLAALQFSTSAFVDIDSYYHTKVAWLLAHGRLSPFKWLPLTVLNEKAYVDHHFLFHVLLAPFVAQSMILGGKWGAVVSASFALVAFLFVLPPTSRAIRIWSFVLFFSGSSGFLYRMSMVRAQSLSLMLLFFCWYAYAEKRYRLLFTLSFIYVWAYNAFPLLLLLAACFCAADFFKHTIIDYRAVIASLAGMVAGCCINPYFPKNILFLYHHLIDKFNFSGFAVSVGGEWYPYKLYPLIENAGIPIVCLFVASILVLRNLTRVASPTVALMLFAWIALALLLRSKRFIELFPPFAIASLAWATHSCLSARTVLQISKAITLAGLLLLVKSWPSTTKEIASANPYTRYSQAAHWLQNNSSHNDLVWTADWDDFPRLFHFNDHNSYLVGMDPYFFYAENPALFKYWVSITEGKVASPLGPVIRKCFGAAYIFLDRGQTNLLRQFELDQSVERVFTNKDSAIFQPLPSVTDLAIPCEL